MAAGGKWLTMSVVVEIEKLVVPLRDYSYCVFEEGDDDQKSANGR